MKLILPKHLLLATLLVALIPLVGRSQNPIIYSQYYLNPYQFNPSYVAHSGQYEANLMYRKQWMGIENAPEAAALNLQAPLGRSVSVGLIASSSKTILLRNTVVSATIGYRVRLGYYHHLNFGLSGGIGLNNFNMDAVAASNDPTLINILQKNTYVVNQFGVNYTYRNFNVGFALPELLDTKPNSTESFQPIKFSPFRQKFASASYTTNITRDIQISPVVIFRSTTDKDFQIEGMVSATYKKVFWLGAGYRDGYGITAYIGFRAANLLRIGYAYDRPLGKLSQATTGSHEIFAGTRFGTRDREEEYFAAKKEKDSLAQVAKLEKERKQQEEQVVADQPKQEPVVQQPEVKEEPVVTQNTPVTEEPVKQEPVVTEPVKKEEVKVAEEKVPEEKKEEPKKEEVKKPQSGVNASDVKGYYVVVGAFRSHENAKKQVRTLQEESMFPEILYVLDRNFYYVYLYHGSDRKKAINELKRMRNKYPRAWLWEPIEKEESGN